MSENSRRQGGHTPEDDIPSPGMASSPEVSRRMSVYPRKDTKPELDLRRELHRRGLRYRVDAPLPGLARRRADLLFTGVRLAVFVDGCFWHGCPEHCRLPKSNHDWWEAKIVGNRERDEDTNARMLALGWAVLRFWEHEDMRAAADIVESIARP